MEAYILITTQKGTEQEVYDELQEMSQTVGVNVIFGEWDLIAKVTVEHTEALGTFILDKIRPIEGVSLTSALIVAK